MLLTQIAHAEHTDWGVKRKSPEIEVFPRAAFSFDEDIHGREWWRNNGYLLEGKNRLRALGRVLWSGKFWKSVWIQVKFGLYERGKLSVPDGSLNAVYNYEGRLMAGGRGQFILWSIALKTSKLVQPCAISVRNSSILWTGLSINSVN